MLNTFRPENNLVIANTSEIGGNSGGELNKNKKCKSSKRKNRKIAMSKNLVKSKDHDFFLSSKIQRSPTDWTF